MYVNSSSDHLLKKTLMIHFEGFETLWRSLLKLFKYRYLNQHSTKFNFNFIWLQKAVFMWILLTMGCQSYTISSTLSLVWNVFWINVLKHRFSSSLKTATGWSSISNILVGQRTETRRCPNALFCSWSDDWPSGRSSMTEEMDARWSTVCECDQLHHNTAVLQKHANVWKT